MEIASSIEGCKIAKTHVIAFPWTTFLTNLQFCVSYILAEM